MNIVVICRTLNERRNIARFCKAYNWANHIIVADGGSRDSTVRIARKYHNVEIRPFKERIYQNGHWRNPHGKHINFMIDEALKLGADWIIFDDCDCVPTAALQSHARGMLEGTDKRVIMLYRLYVWGLKEYFPEMNIPGKSLYAWRADMPVRAVEDEAWGSHCMTSPWQAGDVLELDNPLSCLHYFCQDEAVTQAKLEFYKLGGDAANHPLTYGGALAALPEWARV